MDTQHSASRAWPLVALAFVIALGGAVAWTLARQAPQEALERELERPLPMAPGDYLQPDQIGFAPAPLRPEALREAIDAQERAAPLPDAQLAPLATALAQLHLAELDPAQAAAGAPAQAARQLKLQARELYGAHQVAGFRAALAQLYPPARAALGRLHRAAADKKITLKALWEADAAAHREDFARLGSLIELGPALGLFDPDGAVPPRQEPLLEILFRYRLARTLETITPPETILTLAELRALSLWRLHEARGVDLQRRMRYAAQLGELIPGYPVLAAQGVALAQADKPDEARVAFTQAAQLQPSLRPLMERYLALLPPAQGASPAPSTQGLGSP